MVWSSVWSWFVGTFHWLLFAICLADRKQERVTYCTHTVWYPSALSLWAKEVWINQKVWSLFDCIAFKVVIPVEMFIVISINSVRTTVLNFWNSDTRTMKHSHRSVSSVYLSLTQPANRWERPLTDRVHRRVTWLNHFGSSRPRWASLAIVELSSVTSSWPESSFEYSDCIFHDCITVIHLNLKSVELHFKRKRGETIFGVEALPDTIRASTGSRSSSSRTSSNVMF